MSEWREVSLGEITNKIGSGATPKGGGETYKESGISLIRSQNVLDFKFSNNGLAFIDDSQAYELRNVTVEQNDVLLNITGDSVARCCVVPEAVLPARVNQHVAIIRADKKIAEHHYIYYSLQALKEELLMQSEIGATRNALTKGMLENIKISLPPLEEQKAIASVLSSLDDKIDLLHRQNTTLERMAETLFRQWFVEEAQEDWEEVTLFSLCTLITKGTTPTTLGHSFVEDGINFIKAESINDAGGFISEKFAKISAETHAFLKRSVIQKSDVLCSIAGTIGRVAIVEDSILPANTNQAIAILRVDETKCFPEFIYLFLKSDYFQEVMDGKIVHAVQPNLSLGEIGSTTFKIAPFEKLVEFKKLVKGIFDKKTNNLLQIQTLEKLRDNLLPKLMSGEVRVVLQAESALYA